MTFLSDLSLLGVNYRYRLLDVAPVLMFPPFFVKLPYLIFNLAACGFYINLGSEIFQFFGSKLQGCPMPCLNLTKS